MARLSIPARVPSLAKWMRWSALRTAYRSEAFDWISSWISYLFSSRHSSLYSDEVGVFIQSASADINYETIPVSEAAASDELRRLTFCHSELTSKNAELQLTLYWALAIIVPLQIIWSWYTGRWWVGCYIWYSEEGTGRDRSPPRPLLAVPNVTADPSTARVPITVLLYNGPLLYGFMCSLKG